MNIEHAEEEEEEHGGGPLQDRAAIMWYIRGGLMSYPCMKLGTNRAVTEGEVDLWHWHAAEDNPDSPQYEASAPHPFAADQYSNTEARSSDSGNSAWDIWARGKWSNGVWTLELARKFKTGDAKQDVQFEPGGAYRVTFAIFDGGSGETGESKSTSKWYTLEISNEWLTPPISERVNQLEARVKQLESQVSELLGKIESVTADVERALSAAASASGQLYISMALSAIALIVAIAAIVLSRRK